MKKKIVLIVEDEELQAGAIRMAFENGINALVAKNGIEGLEMALKEHPDLIILDLVMPKMDGFEMFDKLREDPWGADAKVLVLADLSDQEECFVNKGPVEYFEKTDMSLQKLGEKVKEMIGV